jgi:proteasome lid subunit RPN8/RPN11
MNSTVIPGEHRRQAMRGKGTQVDGPVLLFPPGFPSRRDADGMELFLPSAFRCQILAEARIAYPRECCGLLEGSAERITAVHPTRNLAGRSDRFEIDPAEQFRLRRAGRRIVGCYHSHPGGRAEPSPRDAEQAGEAGFLWLICAGTIGAFVWDGAGFQPLVLLETADA